MKISRIALLLAGGRAPRVLRRGLAATGRSCRWTGSCSRRRPWRAAATSSGRCWPGPAAGFVEDALSQHLLGLNAFAKAILGYALTIVSVRVVFGGALAVGAALAAASLANEAIVALLSALLLRLPSWSSRRDALWRAAATGIAGGALEAAWELPVADWWKRRRLRRLR